MSWSTTDAGFNLIQFLDYLRATKPPYFCPYPECNKKRFKSFQGIETHLSRNHAEDYATTLPGASVDDGRASPNGNSPGVAVRGVPWTQAQKIVEVDFEGTLWRLNILEPLELISKKDSELSPDKRSDAVLRDYKNAATLTELPEAKFRTTNDFTPTKANWEMPNHYIRYIERSPEQMDHEVEYDMDEEDYAWLEMINKQREAEKMTKVPETTFEFLMDRLEKESHFQSSQCSQRPNGGPPIDEDAVCCVCQDGECQNTNVILFCDMCNLAVHQECYGIPYIPEGQWLCRRCQLSPSVAVSCCLCPNTGGAFKRTSDGQWAHVICAIWVPEVHFANTVFLEPVEGMETVPAARWKLKCIVCQQRGVGACIQCHKPSCYTAFHVTCAQSAGVYMRVEPCRDPASPGGAFNVRKFIYCDIHAPTGSRAPSEEGSKNGSDNNGGVKGLKTPLANGREESLQARKQLSQKKMRQARKILAQSRNTAPIVSIPVIPKDRLDAITSQVKLANKAPFIRRLVAFWTLKRESRFGVPLLRRLQCAKQNKVVEISADEKQETKEVRTQLKAWRRIRQDLERARLLCELLRKRERLKLEYTNTIAELVDRYLKPMKSQFTEVVDRLIEKDRFAVFVNPVSETEVPGYRSIVEHPMDLSTMRKKAERGQYKSWESLQSDFKTMINNCLQFNKNTAFYVKYAHRMQRMGYKVIGASRKTTTAPVEKEEKPSGESPTKLKNLLQTLKIALVDEKEETPSWSKPKSLDTSKEGVEEEEKPPKKITSKEKSKSPKKQEKRKLLPPPKSEPPKKKNKKKNVDSSMKQTSIFDFIAEKLNAPSDINVKEETTKSPSKPSFYRFRSHEPMSPSSADSTVEESMSEMEDENGRKLPRKLRKHAQEALNRIKEEPEEICAIEPLDLVWAPFPNKPIELPALALDPNMPKAGIINGGFQITAPSTEVLKENPHTRKSCLLRFFDQAKTWAWIPEESVTFFALEQDVDDGKMALPKTKADKTLLRIAYNRATFYRCKVAEEDLTAEIKDWAAKNVKKEADFFS